ncbi:MULTISPECIES: TonB-dependent receptor [Methylomonas]|uniref:TonB-dependent receptor n=2 Tax=Methylomonas TaxID=416 RepID=A0A126T0T2_9GAMM|nr:MULTISPECIES: TonB-dependent receptor [Methylomonas]AMK75698.1 TonB-dependent receptor [Methylomonas denitrificans]OAH98306.1 TonB-dependent receptor [Methylomonas methanica]TCV82476.1 outer membrane receptor protein involved in Fe transport [Methylomonas methanica]
MKFTYTKSLYAIPMAFMMSQAFGAEQTAPDELADVEVIETTPLDGVGKTKDQIPAPVQTATDKDISKTNAVNITDFMNRSMGSVFVNDTQGNGFQPDINYRGFTASPLLGTPQGISVYMDGVRLNQPFGDVVSWDLIPKSAIKSMTMMPGSNPLFGRNTLGGALSMETKDGKSNPGTSVQGLGGAYGRHAFEFEHGGSNKQGLNWFVTGNYFGDDGWRDSSSTTVRQIFGKAGWEGERTDIKFTTAFNDNGLYGNGLQDYRLLDKDYNSIYTKPDITENRSLFLNLEGKHQLNNNIVLAGNTYYRNIKTGTYNGDINEGALDQSVYTLSAAERTALTNAGIAYPSSATSNATSYTPFPYLRCVAQGLLNDEPAEKCNGLINRTTTQQENWGASAQAIVTDKLFGLDNQFLFGGVYDQSVTGFKQSTQLGYLNADRSVTGIPSYADGVTGGDVDGVPFDNQVSLSGDILTWSFFTEDTFSPTKNLHITASGRYNYTSISNHDQIVTSGSESLTGKHAFDRFNPAVGLTYNPIKEIGFYAGYNEGSRAPTSIELGCANPDQPCKLPNAMAGDPPLKQVITENWEVGFRGQLPGKVDWNLGYFHIENKNDIMFVADEQAGFGYFKNFGKTRRQGIEVSLDRKVEDWSVGANYTYLDATYQSNETVNGQGNSTGSLGAGVEGSTIDVRPGNRIPLTPQHMFKTYVDYQITKDWGTNLNIMGFSESFVRGNENNAHQANGRTALGSGVVPGYVVVNYGVRFTPSFVRGLHIFGQVNNILDEQYSTGGQLGPAGLDANGNFTARTLGANQPVPQTTFYSPGAPRTWWLGLRYSF